MNGTNAPSMRRVSPTINITIKWHTVNGGQFYSWESKKSNEKIHTKFNVMLHINGLCKFCTS